MVTFLPKPHPTEVWWAMGGPQLRASLWVEIWALRKQWELLAWPPHRVMGRTGGRKLLAFPPGPERLGRKGGLWGFGDKLEPDNVLLWKQGMAWGQGLRDIPFCLARLLKEKFKNSPLNTWERTTTSKMFLATFQKQSFLSSWIHNFLVTFFIFDP